MSLSRARAHVASGSAGSWLGGRRLRSTLTLTLLTLTLSLRSMRSSQLSPPGIEEHPDTEAIKAPWWTLRPLMAAPQSVRRR